MSKGIYITFPCDRLLLNCNKGRIVEAPCSKTLVVEVGRSLKTIESARAEHELICLVSDIWNWCLFSGIPTILTNLDSKLFHYILSTTYGLPLLFLAFCDISAPRTQSLFTSLSLIKSLKLSL
jgi:hypothetical protein